MGISKLLKPLFISIFVTVFYSGCSKIGEIVGIDIPKDNEIDNAINKSVYYPFQEQMCDWGFRSSGCEEENLTISDLNTTPIDENRSCETGYILVDNECIFPGTGGDELLKDVESKWFDILTKDQQKLIQTDSNNIFTNKNFTILTLLDNIPKDGLKMLQNTKVVLPYYIFNEETDIQLAYVSSSDKEIITPNIIDSSNGAFKVIDSNSIIFLELEAKGQVGESASVSLKVQEEDATKFDKEELNISIVDGNETYNPVSLFFTYNTIFIEENLSKNIYFGISYTIDSNVTVVVRSDLEMILSDDNKTLDLQNLSESNSIVSAFVSNDDGVPFSFRLEAKGVAGDTMELFLVAVDSKGAYDFKKFNIIIVGKGVIEPDPDPTLNPNTSIPTLTGDDFNLLTATQQVLVNNDANRFDPSSIEKPIITIFNPETVIRIPKGGSITFPFYVKDEGKDVIQTVVYDDITKVSANIESYGKFTISYSNKLFFLTLDAVGEVGDIVNITIYSQNANDGRLYDQETFKVEIISPDDDGTYIEPLIYLGFNKLYIEEAGFRTGLQFSIIHSENIVPEIIIEDETVIQFLKWVSISPPKFSIEAIGKAGDTTTLTIRAFDGIKADERIISITIIPVGDSHENYDETIGSTTPSTPTKPEPKECNTGFHLENSICVVDAVGGSCAEGYIEDDNGDCVDGNKTVPRTCPTDYHLNADNECDPDATERICPTGFSLENGECKSDETGTVIDPICNINYHIENGDCVADEIPISCDTGFTLQNGKCISDETGDIADPICEDGYHIENDSCTANIDDPICEDGYNLKDGVCEADDGGDPITPTCGTGFHLEDNQCLADKVNPTCADGYYLSDGECHIDNTGGDTDPIPPMCQDGYTLQDGVCNIDLVCETDFHIENSECIADIPTCTTGFHIENSICVEDGVADLNCTDGQIEENGICIDDTSRDLTDIAYEDWTDSEKAKVSLEICSLKIDEAGYSVIEATAVTAEGFQNELGTLILHTTKTPIVNGITQNVTLKMIYKEIYTASPTSKILDSTFRIPKFRIDYTMEYSASIFYIIDDSDGKCYVNTFPSENTIPFGILDIVKPDGM